MFLHGTRCCWSISPFLGTRATPRPVQCTKHLLRIAGARWSIVAHTSRGFPHCDSCWTWWRTVPAQVYTRSTLFRALGLGWFPRWSTAIACMILRPTGYIRFRRTWRKHDTRGGFRASCAIARHRRCVAATYHPLSLSMVVAPRAGRRPMASSETG